jgi:hypothetical protein
VVKNFEGRKPETNNEGKNEGERWNLPEKSVVKHFEGRKPKINLPTLYLKTDES